MRVLDAMRMLNWAPDGLEKGGDEPDGKVRQDWYSEVKTAGLALEACMADPDSTLPEKQDKYRAAIGLGLALFGGVGARIRSGSLPLEVAELDDDHFTVLAPWQSVILDDVISDLEQHPFDDLEKNESALEKTPLEELIVNDAAERLEILGDWIEAKAVESVLEMEAAIRGLIEKHEELSFLVRDMPSSPHHGTLKVAIQWRRKPTKSRGALVLGKARKASSKERALWPKDAGAPPHGIVELSLAAWIANPHDQEWMLHHELMHFGRDGLGLALVGHDTECFAEELRIYGIRHAGQARVISAAVVNPTTAERLEQVYALSTGQLAFLEEEGAEVIELARSQG